MAVEGRSDFEVDTRLVCAFFTGGGALPVRLPGNFRGGMAECIDEHLA